MCRQVRTFNYYIISHDLWYERHYWLWWHTFHSYIGDQQYTTLATSSGIVDSLLQPRFISSSGVWESRPIPCRFDSEFSYRFKNRNLVSELIFDCLHRTSTHPWNSDGLFESFRDVRSSSSSARISSILRWSFLMNIVRLRANGTSV